jgi:SAM-dependent methyltransferase
MVNSLLIKKLRDFVKKRRFLVRLFFLLRYPQLIVHNYSLRRQNKHQNGVPIPPGRLIFLVQGSDSVGAFLHSGALGVQNIQNTLAKNNIDFYHFGNILDFGCGAGRILRYWKELEGPQLYGVDIQPDLIQWCRLNLPFAHFQVNQINEKLNFKDACFDFTYSFSVFTHMTEKGQLFWINELTRVLRPGGYLMLTTHGDYYFSKYILPANQPEYSNGKMIVYSDKKEGSNICLAYHPFSYVRDHLASHLTLLDYIPQGALGNPCQDLYLFQKPVGIQ